MGLRALVLRSAGLSLGLADAVGLIVEEARLMGLGQDLTRQRASTCLDEDRIFLADLD